MTESTDSEGRIEPSFDPNANWENITFLRGPVQRPAGFVLRCATLLLAAVVVAFSLYMSLSNRRSWPEVLGGALGAVFTIMVPVWLASWWDEQRTQSARYKIAAVTSCVLIAVQFAAFYRIRGSLTPEAGVPLGSQQLVQRALRCEGAGDLACAEESWAQYLKINPEETRAITTLGIVKSKRDDHIGAIQQYERALSLGAGGYDLFAYYAASLARSGRAKDAVTWYYAALAVSPRLVDVRSALAKILVAEGRPYEALAVLQAFDSQLEASGKQPYFTAQRTSIEALLSDAGHESRSEEAVLQLPAFGGHFFAPVKVGWGRPIPFMIDTGATLTSLSLRMLEESRVGYQVIDTDAGMITADGRRVPAQVVILRDLRVGPYKLGDVKAIACKDCALLLGASVLTRFDMKSSKIRGLEVMSLVPR